MEFMAFQAVVIICATAGFVASLRFVRQYLELRNDRRIAPPPPAETDRLERIEMIVEATAIEVERISEANRFLAKLLAERTGAPTPSSRPERVITPH